MEFVTHSIPLNEKLAKSEINKLASKFGIPTKSGISFVQKAFSESIGKDAQFNDGERSVIKIASTAAVDRDGEIVIPSGIILDHYLKHPVVVAGHDYTGLPIGKNQWVKVTADGYSLLEKTVYSGAHAMAREYYEYQKEGMPLAASIGFVPMEYCTKGDRIFEAKCAELMQKGWLDEAGKQGLKRIYTKVLLLEISDVAVPSNPEALMVAVGKGFGGIVAKNLPIIKITSKDSEGKTVNTVEKALTHNSKLNDSEPDWGDVDKTKLPEKAFVFEASGHDSENKSTWSYPHHYVVGGEVGEDGYYTSGDMYLHKGGLNAAYAAAMGARTGEVADQPIIDHLMAHREAVGMMEEDAMDGCEPGMEEDACKPKKDANTPIAKAMDIAGYPSMHDIASAVVSAWQMVNNTMSKSCMLEDIYPTEYPNGYCIIEVFDYSGGKCEEKYYRHSYTYDVQSGKATLSEPLEIREQWAVKGFRAVSIERANERIGAIVKEGRVLSGRNRSAIEAAITALQDVLSIADEGKEKKSAEIEKPKFTIKPSEKKVDNERVIREEIRKSITTMVTDMKNNLNLMIAKTIQREIALKMGRVVYDD